MTFRVNLLVVVGSHMVTDCDDERAYRGVRSFVSSSCASSLSSRRR